jgi:CBS domain-containing protein
MPWEIDMKVKDLMVCEVRTCAADDTLNHAAHLMWEGDCGVVPVVDAGKVVVGMITDRDICMAAYTRGETLASIRVGDAMATRVTSCAPDSTADTAMALMKVSQVHRLPVVDAQGQLVGILALNDFSRETRRQPKGSARQSMSVGLAETLETISKPRHTRATGPNSEVKHPA